MIRYVLSYKRQKHQAPKTNNWITTRFQTVRRLEYPAEQTYRTPGPSSLACLSRIPSFRLSRTSLSLNPRDFYFKTLTLKRCYPPDKFKVVK
jgi:hypothetical protein